jgi:hypothetical protein
MSSAVTTEFAILDPLQHPLTEAVILAAALGDSQPAQTHLATNATGSKSQNAAKILAGVYR